MADDLYLSAVDLHLKAAAVLTGQHMGADRGISSNLVSNLFPGFKTLASGLPS